MTNEMTNEISNSEDVIDSRDIIARIEHLESLEPDEIEDEEQDELDALKALADECEGYGDWQYGETLISRDYFIEYVQDMLADCGDIPEELPPFVVIDWQATADNVEADYMTVEFDGVDYLMRS